MKMQLSDYKMFGNITAILPYRLFYGFRDTHFFRYYLGGQRLQEMGPPFPEGQRTLLASCHGLPPCLVFYRFY